MNIGEAAEASGVSAKMIRYYEEIALISRANRTSSGYRTYSEADIEKLRFIRRARDLGFPLAVIQELLSLWSDRKRKSSDVKRIAEAHIAELELRIDGLREMAETLQSLVSSCAGDNRPNCPILVGLESGNSITCKSRQASDERARDESLKSKLPRRKK